MIFTFHVKIRNGNLRNNEELKEHKEDESIHAREMEMKMIRPYLIKELNKLISQIVVLDIGYSSFIKSVLKFHNSELNAISKA